MRREPGNLPRGLHRQLTFKRKLREHKSAECASESEGVAGSFIVTLLAETNKANQSVRRPAEL